MQCLCHFFGIHRKDRLLDGGIFIAIFLSELFGQRLDRVRQRFGGCIQQTDLLDVQFIRDHIGIRCRLPCVQLALLTENATAASG